MAKKNEASRVAAEIEARSIFAPNLLVSAAETFAAIGDTTRARELYTRAVTADPTAQRSEVHFALAALQIQARDFAGARRTLRNAARNPAAQITEPLIAFLTAAGRVEQFEEETAAFPLAPSTRDAVRRAVLNAHLAAGRTGAALALVEDHLELVDAASCEALRAAADPVRTAAVIERALAQRTIPGATPVLARIYSARAKKELASFQFDAALPLLQRAHDLDHSLWEAAEQLARLYIDRKSTTDAARVLRAFLSSTSDTPSRLAAERLLARIQAP